MRYLIVFVVFVVLLVSEPVLVSGLSVQAQTNAQEKAASLRSQLLELETRQAELQTRLQALDEQMKPENIASTLAGVGSTRPEDLREQRRRQLEIERNGLQRQLELLNTSHSRLETAVAQADADAYRQSAAPVAPGVAPVKGPAVDAGQNTVEPVTTATPTKRPRRLRKKRTKRPQRSHHSQLY